MNYYKRHIGDYARSTMHLTVLEHGVYCLLLDRYYDTEQPFNMEQARRYVRAATEPGVDVALQNVLNEFFERNPDGLYHSRRIERELADAATRADSARANGQRGGRPRKKPLKPQKEAAPTLPPAEEEPNGLAGDSEVKTNPPIHESTNPEKPPQAPKGEQVTVIVDATDTTGDEDQGDEHDGDDEGDGDEGGKAPVVKYSDSFLRWWNAYPAHRRAAKPKCFLVWKRKRMWEFEETLIDDVRKRIAEDHKWKKDGGQFIPNTQTYLNQERWNDGFEEPPRGQGKAHNTEVSNNHGGQDWANNQGGNFDVE
jgi:uncharacterized protein YdaU (DUF1376 family)